MIDMHTMSQLTLYDIQFAPQENLYCSQKPVAVIKPGNTKYRYTFHLESLAICDIQVRLPGLFIFFRVFSACFGDFLRIINLQLPKILQYLRYNLFPDFLDTMYLISMVPLYKSCRRCRDLTPKAPRPCYQTEET
jgi:hypothetical protein